MSDLLNKLKEHLNSITSEEFEKEWAEIEGMGFKGPQADRYVEILTKNIKRTNRVYQFMGTAEQFTDFVKKYPVRITTESPYQVNRTEYCFNYVPVENFEIKESE